MKILAVAEFDCAGVLTGHRRALRDLGVDYRIAVVDEYRYRKDLVHDWPLPDGTIAGLKEFANQADVLQFHPSIGQPWSYQTTAPRLDDGEMEGLFGIDWTVIPASRVSLFHGSRNAAVNAKLYAEHWRRRDHNIWATTLDYVEEMGAAWAPPAVYLDGPRAPLRGDDDPLIVIQAPTDPDFCHTAEFLNVCRDFGCVADLVHRRPHEEVIGKKRHAHAGFDHLRGAFSVNTLENLALGLVPLVGLKPEYRRQLRPGGMAAPNLLMIKDVGTFRYVLKILAGDPEMTRKLQNAAHAWFEEAWRPELIGARLKAMYEALP